MGKSATPEGKNYAIHARISSLCTTWLGCGRTRFGSPATTSYSFS